MRAQIIAVAMITAAVATVVAGSAAAHGGGHGFGRGFGHEAHFAGGPRHGDDAAIKAASDDRDKLLTTKLKSICHGC
jgi:hypothetical protein